MTKVPQINFPKPEKPKNTAIYCFRPGTSKADMAHDLAEIEKFKAYRIAQAAKRKAKK